MKLGNDAKAQARADAVEMRQGKKLILKSITRQNKDDKTIQKCVDFILSDNNVSSVAWGTKRVLLQSIGEITLPKLTRKKQYPVCTKCTIVLLPMIMIG